MGQAENNAQQPQPDRDEVRFTRMLIGAQEDLGTFLTSFGADIRHELGSIRKMRTGNAAKAVDSMPARYERVVLDLFSRSLAISASLATRLDSLEESLEAEEAFFEAVAEPEQLSDFLHLVLDLAKLVTPRDEKEKSLVQHVVEGAEGMLQGLSQFETVEEGEEGEEGEGEEGKAEDAEDSVESVKEEPTVGDTTTVTVTATGTATDQAKE